MSTQPDPVSAGLIVAFLTLLSGFGAWALGHFLYVRLAPESLRRLPGWTAYQAAFWGDLLVLPALNGLMVWILYRLPINPFGAYFLPVIAALLVTTFVHFEQALTKHVNWTMPRPWRWNSFGFYHALFMAVNLTLTFFFIEQAITHWFTIVISLALAVGFLAVLAGWLVMLLLYFVDRRRFVDRTIAKNS